MVKGYILVAAMIALIAVLVGGSLSNQSAAVISASQQLVAADSPSADEDSSDPRIVPEEGAVALERSGDGHFYADIEINGAQVRALIDTGASGIALSREDALSAGIATSIGMPDVVGRGADGDVLGEHVTLDRVTMGHRTAEGMSAVVLNSGEQTLLGQSFLSKFESVEIRGDTMVLR